MTSVRLPWMRLLTSPVHAFQRLPFVTRGLADELLRAADGEGRVDVGQDEAPHVVLMRMLGAHPKERRAVKGALEELITHGFVRHEGPHLVLLTPDADATRARPKRDKSTTSAEHERDVSATRARHANGLTSTESFNTGPGEVEERGREEREIEERGENNTQTRARARVVAPPAVDALEYTKRELDRAATLLTVSYAKRYEIAAGALWGGLGKSKPDIRSVAAWSLATARKQSLEPDAVIVELLDRVFAATGWLADNRWPWAAIAKDPAGVGLRSKSKSGPAPARQHHEFNDDDPDVIWGPREATQ